MNEIITSVVNKLSSKVSSQKGVTTVEYAIMLVLVALAVAAVGTTLSTAVKAVFTDMVAAING